MTKDSYKVKTLIMGWYAPVLALLGKGRGSSLLHEGCPPSSSWIGSSCLNLLAATKRSAMHQFNERTTNMRPCV
jgi:hypothetical protein